MIGSGNTSGPEPTVGWMNKVVAGSNPVTAGPEWGTPSIVVVVEPGTAVADSIDELVVEVAPQPAQISNGTAIQRRTMD